MNCPRCGGRLSGHKNPTPTVDTIIELDGGIVLVARKNTPLGWALPGGFVDYGESLEEAAVREAAEETGLKIRLVCQLHTYSNPDRDARRHTITTVFIATASDQTPKGADDASEARVFPLEEIPELAFDHDKIVEDYLRFKKEGSPYGHGQNPYR